ncbi:MAG: hypothetical protein F6K31_42965 [Symploca sp. SIO2G7]|nr:hypothetical protein [Symploca sp. SIO2G7]
MQQNSTDTTFTYTFPNGQIAYVLDVPDSLSYAESITALGLTKPTPSMVVIGGASKMSNESRRRVSQVFTRVLAPFAQTHNITVFDGGTDAGVIQMMGQARHHVGGTFNLVGIAPKAKISLPGYFPYSNGDTENKDLITLEKNHTHFALIPGITWGSESPWLAHCASKVANNFPSITILINGGKISLSDLTLNLSVGRQAIIIAGSGRLADEIANTISGTIPYDDSIQKLAAIYYPSQISIFKLSNSLDNLTKQLKSHFNKR